MFDDIFGGMFDFNGDGHTDFAEEALGFAIMEDMMSEDESDDDFEALWDEMVESVEGFGYDDLYAYDCGVYQAEVDAKIAAVQ